MKNNDIIDAITVARHALYGLGGMSLDFKLRKMLPANREAVERTEAYNVLAEFQHQLAEQSR